MTLQKSGAFSLVVAAYMCFVSEGSVDKQGYVMYCPCMGRFGNQADHFLGSLAFTRGLGRTLVVPPWVEYPPGSRRSHQEPYSSYFKIEALAEYLPVISMEEFMQKHAASVWPEQNRTAFCYGARGSTGGCSAKQGNPFGPFWDTFNIDFSGSRFYGGHLSFNTLTPGAKQKWDQMFPVSQYPVLAFAGAPATFPVDEKHVELAKYMQWSDSITSTMTSYIKDNLSDGPFIGVHLRTGSDWKKACGHVEERSNRNLFGSSQCLGHRLEHGQVTPELCYPGEGTILSKIKSVVKSTGATSVFIASDENQQPLIAKIKKMLKGKVRVVQRLPSNPHVDLALLTEAHHYIGNCVSTFSAFVTRYRLTHSQKPSSFWGFVSKQHDEL